MLRTRPTKWQLVWSVGAIYLTIGSLVGSIYIQHGVIVALLVTLVVAVLGWIIMWAMTRAVRKSVAPVLRLIDDAKHLTMPEARERVEAALALGQVLYRKPCSVSLNEKEVEGLPVAVREILERYRALGATDGGYTIGCDFIGHSTLLVGHVCVGRTDYGAELVVLPGHEEVTLVDPTVESREEGAYETFPSLYHFLAYKLLLAEKR
jgi:hypothetical protein